MIQDLVRLQMVEVEQDGKRFLLRSEVQGTCGTVFRAAGASVPPTVQQAKPDPAAPEPDPGATPRMRICKQLCYNRLRLYTVENLPDPAKPLEIEASLHFDLKQTGAENRVISLSTHVFHLCHGLHLKGF
ncbi:MAG: hypothetical protein ACXWPK_10040, partial [Isosphaeraceae bacterium]